MCKNETAERRVILKELCAISSHVVDRSSGSKGSSGAPGILLSSRSRSILEEVTNGVARGRFGSEEMRVGRPRTAERMITSSEEL